jgi:hypothetical protein
VPGSVCVIYKLIYLLYNVNMPRPNRIVVENGWYHVFNRGISRKTICFSEFHYLMFCQLMREMHELYDIEIHSYCMMKNLFTCYFTRLSPIFRRVCGI